MPRSVGQLDIVQYLSEHAQVVPRGRIRTYGLTKSQTSVLFIKVMTYLVVAFPIQYYLSSKIVHMHHSSAVKFVVEL